eukprot:gene10782-12562_t
MSKIILFSNKSYWTKFFDECKKDVDITYLDGPICEKSVELAKGYQAVCVFVNDVLNKNTLKRLKEGGTKLILLRSAGFNNVDMEAAHSLGFTVLRVPSYSPYAVAEFAVAMIMTLNRKTHKAYNRVRESNFNLEGLEGFDMRGKTVGIAGTGKIGCLLAGILNGFGCKLIGYDIYENEEAKKLGLKYVPLEELWKQSDIISLHAPLTKETKYMVNDKSIEQMKDGVMLINTSRGALVDTKAVIKGLKSGKIGYLGMDVYEEEADLFFDDQSDRIMQDDILARLMTFPNVLVTGHQAWFTKQALQAICETTVDNFNDFQKGTIKPANLVEYKPSKITRELSQDGVMLTVSTSDDIRVDWQTTSSGTLKEEWQVL